MVVNLVNKAITWHDRTPIGSQPGLKLTLSSCQDLLCVVQASFFLQHRLGCSLPAVGDRQVARGIVAGAHCQLGQLPVAAVNSSIQAEGHVPLGPAVCCGRKVATWLGGMDYCRLLLLLLKAVASWLGGKD